MATAANVPLDVVGEMIVAEISENLSGVWSGQLRESDTGDPLGESWQAQSRAELIATMRHWLPLSHVTFQDRMDPLDP